jgi:hypothetical protein
MATYQLTGLPDTVADEARLTGRSPGYGHPVHREVAGGTGPCRSCLGLFQVGEEERLLFTYRPDLGPSALGAPGPIFIHARECTRYEGTTLPEGLLRLPLLIEGRTHDGRTSKAEIVPGGRADQVIRAQLDDERVDFVTLRHGEAGCFIATVDRR